MRAGSCSTGCRPATIRSPLRGRASSRRTCGASGRGVVRARPLRCSMASGRTGWFFGSCTAAPSRASCATPTGGPCPGIDVVVMSAEPVTGAQTPLPAGTPSTTDDRGVYRVFGLAPGDYYVRAAHPRPGAAGHGTRGHAGRHGRRDRMGGAGDVERGNRRAATSALPPPDRGRSVAYAPVLLSRRRAGVGRANGDRGPQRRARRASTSAWFSSTPPP